MPDKNNDDKEYEGNMSEKAFNANKGTDLTPVDAVLAQASARNQDMELVPSKDEHKPRKIRGTPKANFTVQHNGSYVTFTKGEDVLVDNDLRAYLEGTAIDWE